MSEVSTDPSTLLNTVQVKTLKLAEGTDAKRIGLPEPRDAPGKAPSRNLEPAGVHVYSEAQMYMFVKHS